MSLLRIRHLTWIAVLTVTLAACGAGGDADPAAVDDGEAAPGVDAPVAEAPEDDDGEVVGVIESGAATRAPAPTDPPARPTTAGVQRTIDLRSAAGSVPFELLVPTALPDETYLDVVHLIEPIEGTSTEGLPAVRLIYTIASRSAFVVYEAPDAGAPLPEGEALEIGGAQGVVTENGARVLTWVRDGVRYEIRSQDLDTQMLVGFAESLAPVGSPTRSPDGGAGEAGEDTAGDPDAATPEAGG